MSVSRQFESVVSFLAKNSHRCPRRVSVKTFLASHAHQWKLDSFDYAYEGTVCPCRTAIRRMCLITNIASGKEVYIGADCFSHLSNQHQAINAVETALQRGVTARLRQITRHNLYFVFDDEQRKRVILDCDQHVKNHFGGASPWSGAQLKIRKAYKNQPALVCGEVYQFVATMSAHPTKPQAVYTMIALANDAQAIRDDQEYHSASEVEEEDEYADPTSSSSSSSYSANEDEEEVSESIEEESSEKDDGYDDDEDEDDHSEAEPSGESTICRPKLVKRPRVIKSMFDYIEDGGD